MSVCEPCTQGRYCPDQAMTAAGPECEAGCYCDGLFTKRLIYLFYVYPNFKIREALLQVESARKDKVFEHVRVQLIEF